MPTLIPLDANDTPIPALRLKSGGAHHISASAIAARNATAFDAATQIVSVFATVPVYVKFGDASVTATTSDHYFPDGLYYDIAIGGDKAVHYTHVSILRADTDGDVYISEKE